MQAGFEGYHPFNRTEAHQMLFLEDLHEDFRRNYSEDELEILLADETLDEEDRAWLELVYENL